MDDRIWKYVSAVLTLLLALSIVSVAVLYYQVNPPAVPANQTGFVIETPSNFTLVCEGSVNTTSTEVAELRDQIAFLQRLVSSNQGGTTIAVVPIFGIIDDYTALQVIPLLRNLAMNESVGGVLLWIESPGGVVGPVINIHSEIKKLSLVKPVVAYSGDIIASGGYYIAVGAQKIVASPLAEVGSIGVIYVHYDLEKNYEMNGIKVNVFKTGKHKDMGAEWRDLTPEEREKITEMVNTYFQAFISAVSEGRNMTIDEVKNFSTGETWFAENVTGALVDELGGMDTAIDVLEKLMNVSGAKVVVYKDLETPEEFGVYGSTALYIDPRYLTPLIGGG
ncbi:predicted endopeptidase IV, S49 family [Thermococcus kodakarensis KOD1]|uniref:Predicted endopeptidase IV, S49 family n=1 Tax=Thermococcus kodakarensis (strain ATCC BAA-918 / JCM 12380 / KOD1) TaxID=69014 RepID=Q5JE91_THEKO|nr:signal peptide peptidase SppA [Thermococcus kodakarensis]WCN29108.1 signal peptide peptidase SppA [Thermococcus kodakarensis]WCN31411.1 signal peptide peptidase SppA [Thermococcus kodakarensis]BAD85353.1 predicted endopeptidase IV, S49 family [Thermococcus kodakarensis KOD1]